MKNQPKRVEMINIDQSQIMDVWLNKICQLAVHNNIIKCGNTKYY